jgi:tetratricopeptide (TPR) repeat protein
VVLFVVLGNARLALSESDRMSRRDELFPEATLQWIRLHTPPEAALLSGRAPAVSLYTGRRCVFSPQRPVYDREELRYQLLREAIRYVLDQPVFLKHLPGDPVNMGGSIRRWLSWAASWPEAFRPVYRNAAEGTTLYELTEDGAFLKGFELCSAARRQLEQSRFDAGFRELDLALAVQPRLVKALDAYGAASVLSGCHLAAGEAKLRQALRIEPDDFWAWLNLARLYRKTGRRAQAHEAFERARDALARAPELSDMAPVVAREAAD